MATSFRQFMSRTRRWLGWATDDRELEHDADVDQAKQQLFDTVDPVDAEPPASAEPEPSSEGGIDPDDPDSRAS